MSDTPERVTPLGKSKHREKWIYYWSGECWFKCRLCGKRCDKSLVIEDKEMFICDDCLKEVFDE